jgi:glycosyltransferase involved in cell wall biosynthesis
MIQPGNPVFLTLLIIFGISFLVQAFYYLYFYLAPARPQPPEPQVKQESVSVIICARNEEENLRKFLPAVLEQDYPDFEVIVVNDCSEDGTDNVLAGFLKTYPRLRVSNITRDPKFTHNKKFAQFIGIKAARNELLLFTDADCRPESSKWIGKMASRFEEKTSFVLGYGGYFTGKGLLNRYIRYDCMTIAVQYLGMALRGMPYMGVGRNLAYRKSLFFERKGFGQHSHLASGDDDLFVNSNATPENIAVEFGKESHTRSVPALNISGYVKQKSRHLTTARHYRTAHKIILLGEPVSRVVFYAFLVILLSRLYAWPLVAGLFLVRLIIQLIVFFLNRKKFNEPGILPLFPIFDLVSPFINAAFFAGSLREGRANTTWK